jgi:hypothetical protein
VCFCVRACTSSLTQPSLAIRAESSLLHVVDGYALVHESRHQCCNRAHLRCSMHIRCRKALFGAVQDLQLHSGIWHQPPRIKRLCPLNCNQRISSNQEEVVVLDTTLANFINCSFLALASNAETMAFAHNALAMPLGCSLS